MQCMLLGRRVIDEKLFAVLVRPEDPLDNMRGVDACDCTQYPDKTLRYDACCVH